MPMLVDALLRGSEELASDIMRGLVCGCWSAGAVLRVLVCRLCKCTLYWRAADPPESHCARHLEIISYQLRHLEFFTTSPS